MADNANNKVGIKQQVSLEQVVTDALAREKFAAPSVDKEWERLAGRMALRTIVPAMESKSQERAPKRASLRTYWVTAGIAAAVAILFVFTNVGDRKHVNVNTNELYVAQKTSKPVVILNDNKEEQIVATKELKVSKEDKADMQTIVVPEGKDVKVMLSDGTEVWINANSRLSYPTAFNDKERRVELQGEAYFNVAHDAEHPFVVKAGAMETRVLGTQFNVVAHEAQQPEVTLVEGSVEVSAAGTNKVITPSEKAKVGEQGNIQVSHADVKDVTCWKDGVELFDNAPLRDILVQMGIWYNISVVCRNHAGLDLRLRYMYNRNEGIEEAIKILNSMTKKKIKLQDNTIIVE